MSERRLRRLFQEAPVDAVTEKIIAADLAPDTNTTDPEQDQKQVLLLAVEKFVTETVLSLKTGATVYFEYDVADALHLPQQMIANAIQAKKPSVYITYSYVFADYEVGLMLGADRKPNGKVIVRKK